jgi:cobalt-zinc-cadmium efflux system outer membrane protein
MPRHRALATVTLPIALIAIGCRSTPPDCQACRQVRQTRQEPPASPPPASAIARAPEAQAIRLASGQEPAVPKADDKKADDKKEAKEKIDLPTAIQLCTLQNFRLQASATKIAQAEADLLTASLIPNASLYTDLQLLPLQRANLNNQLGPPQQDAIFTIPIDWLVFGKRVAAMQAQQLGVAVVRADQDDAIRRAVSQTVDTFYAVLQAEEMLKLTEEEYEDAKRLQVAVGKQVDAGKAGDVEKNHVRLVVHEALLAVHARDLELTSVKAKLRPLIGRTATDPDFEVVGVLEVKAVVPVPDLKAAIALAELHRPDLLSDRNSIAQAGAVVHLEKRRAKPQAAITPGWSYQYQRPINGFRNGSMLDMGILFTLPITDRNQGNIRKAQWQLAESRLTHQANVADVRTEVEIIVATYADAVEDITENNDPATLKAASELHRKVDAEFTAGQRKLVEVLAARKASVERQARNIEFQATYWRVLNQLNNAVGLTAYDPATGATIPVEYGKKEPEPKKK